jgi:hypothetical protein
LVGSTFAIEAQRGAVPQPVTITIHYIPPVGADEDELTVVHYDATGGKWLPLPTMIDAVNHTATTTADHWGRFALVWLRTASSLPSGAMIVDDLDAGFARYGNPSYWYEASSPPDPTGWYYDDHIYWTQNNVETVDNYAVWTAPATLDGPREVWVFVPANHATTEHARYTIYSWTTQ